MKVQIMGEMENNGKKPGFVLHPVLFAAYPVLLLYSHNIQEATFLDTIPSMITIVGITLLLLLLGALLFRNITKTGVVLSVSLLLCFSFREAFYSAQNLLHVGSMPLALTVLIIWCLIFISTLYFVVKTHKQLRNITKILNVMSGTLIVIVLASILSKGHRSNSSMHNIAAVDVEHSSFVPAAANELPDIYYIIVDRYARADSMKEFYDFDNSEFINYLTAKGFYIAFESNSNYPGTAHSLASSLNMDYLHIPCDQAGPSSASWLSLYSMLENHKLGLLLKAKGYKYIHFGSWWNVTSKNKQADINVNYGWLSEFSRALYKSTVLYPVLRVLFGWDEYRLKYERVLYKFGKLAEIPKMREPTFVFAHFLLPHLPYAFDKDGNFVTRIEAMRKGDKAGYIEQLLFTNQKIKSFVENVLAGSEKPPIIILQADEGPYPKRSMVKDDYKWQEVTTDQLRQKFGILNAYYLPNVDKSALYPSITPVNSFRLIFNLYFDGQYELLPDRSYVFEDRNHLYNFFDVTEKLSKNKADK